LSAQAQEFAPATRSRPEAFGRTAAEAGRLFSPSTAQVFYEMGYDLAHSGDITGPVAQQAITFLEAAGNLGGAASDVQALLLRLACRHAERDYSRQVKGWLVGYVDESADVGLVKEAVRYLLDRLNSREQREQLLEELLAGLSGRNDVVDSDLATLLGLLKAEKGDLDTAQSHLVRAYQKNKYNKVAFAKLAELVPDRIGPATYLEHLRLVLRENPMDVDAALDFARYAERLQLYEVAAGVYAYCADLFGYMYPAKHLPPHIYLPWVISNYNTEDNRHKALQIAQRVRQTNRFDILLEALAGKAALEMGDVEEAKRIFRSAEQRAQQLIKQGPGTQEPSAQAPAAQISAKQFAWFYCFAYRDPTKALDWANKAYSTDPNSSASAALLAYALVMNEQMEWAKPLIENRDNSQIAGLAHARILLAEGKKDAGLEALTEAIGKDPGSLAAERARGILTEQGSQYVPPVDPGVMLNVLQDRFGKRLTPVFVSPEKIVSVQFSVRGNEFSYGSEFDGNIAVINHWSEPLVISDDGLSTGIIRIDAHVTGDVTKQIPKLVSRSIRSTFVLEPEQAMSTSLPLVTGELKRVLSTYPQANLQIEFTLYIDPVTTEQGQVTNRLADVEPIKMVVSRPGIELTAKYLRNRFNSISTGQAGQKVKIAQLFVGLLKEQYAMAEHGVLYRFKYADWMQALLKSALLHESGLLLNPADNEWSVKVHTMADMVSLPLDHELTTVLAKNLNNTRWPVRLMTMYLLAKSEDGKFDRVLNWSAEHDPSRLVRDMAEALSAAASSESTGPTAALNPGPQRIAPPRL
jgi:Tfp pilus assembly protein PilN